MDPNYMMVITENIIIIWVLLVVSHFFHLKAITIQNKKLPIFVWHNSERPHFILG